jgi:hypothetical protein
MGGTELAAEALKRGREYLAKGWCQHTYTRGSIVQGTFECCADAARMWGCSQVPSEHYAPVCRAIADAMTPLLIARGYDRGRLAAYNDDPRTTQADVLALFHEAIARLEGAS